MNPPHKYESQWTFLPAAKQVNKWRSWSFAPGGQKYVISVKNLKCEEIFDLQGDQDQVSIPQVPLQGHGGDLGT